jgi:hypothetical protein
MMLDIPTITPAEWQRHRKAHANYVGYRDRLMHFRPPPPQKVNPYAVTIDGRQYPSLSAAARELAPICHLTVVGMMQRFYRQRKARTA